MQKENRKIHIGFLTERMLRGFGVDVVVDKTARELVKNGFRVTVFCINADGNFNNDEYQIVQVKSSLHHNPFKTERSAKKALERLNIEEDIDIWIAETYPFFMATQIMDRPVIVIDHGVAQTKGFNIIRRIIFAYIKFAHNYIYFKKADRLVHISKFIRSLTPTFLRKKQLVVYNGADNYKHPTKDEILRFKMKNNIKNDDKILLYVGRINSNDQPYKGTKELVGVFKKLRKKYPSLKLIMAGFGNKKDGMWLKSAGIIPFLNADDKDIALLYSITDCYVTASKWEGFNLPLVEAGHFSVPYVAYNIGAHKEVVNDKSGFLVNTKKDFISSIEKIISNENLRNNMSENARKNAERFMWKKTGLRYSNLIKEVVGKNKKKYSQYDKGMVDIITLNYNGKKHLKPLFNSLKEQTYENIRVTMVDNGSSDGSCEYVKKEFPWVNLIRSDTNLFFSRGNNLAVNKTKGEYIFFVNNDIVVEPDAIQNLVNTINKKGKYNIASVAAKMLLFNNRRVFDSTGVVILSNGAPFNRGIGQIDIGQYDKVEEIFGACFGAVLIRRNVYEKSVGPLDNSYFGYFEDVDWNYRARIFGYKSYFCPKAVVYHDHSATSKKMGYEWKYYLIHRNFLKTIIKNFQFKRMILKGGYKTLELINHLRKTKDRERKLSILKILLHVTYSMPLLIFKRFRIQRKRCAPDIECVKFSQGEQSFFDAVNYSPILTLDTLQAMFARLDMIKKFNNFEISDIVSQIAYLNERKMMMNEKNWDTQTEKLIKSLERYIGKRYVDKFIKAVVIDKIWKK